MEAGTDPKPGEEIQDRRQDGVPNPDDAAPSKQEIEREPNHRSAHEKGGYDSPRCKSRRWWRRTLDDRSPAVLLLDRQRRNGDRHFHDTSPLGHVVCHDDLLPGGSDDPY